MHPQFHLLSGHALAEIAGDFVSHGSHPSARFARGHPPPSGEGLVHCSAHARAVERERRYLDIEALSLRRHHAVAAGHEA